MLNWNKQLEYKTMSKRFVRALAGLCVLKDWDDKASALAFVTGTEV
jgi:hypothetical protein